MKDVILFGGCFLIGFLAAKMGYSMFDSVTNFIVVSIIVVAWGIGIEQVSKLLKKKENN